MINLKSIAISVAFATVSFSANANLLVNAGFEDNLNHWSAIGTAKIRTSDPAPYEGSRYLYGRGQEFTVWQDVDLLGNGYSVSDLDAGTLTLQFGGWQSGWGDGDIGQIAIMQLASDMSVISSANLNSFTSNKIWEEQVGETGLIAGTRYLRFEFHGDRHAGVNNDAYLDAAYLSVAAVPIPSAVLLFGSALVGFAGLGRKKRSSEFRGQFT